ncbi:hypothetical protein [Citrobacter phage CVT22]|uniref:Uncharacterized protein n=1 Tax=Citrobacter phage CVT22 TaxID=1622234 RepID=A0A0R6CFT7_9CAUD|nr:hypothetical protein APL39_gp46 [Citrobacter phage CVT22]AJT60750.1 hypothetical protein [Citrobacter phage CVT22]
MTEETRDYYYKSVEELLQKDREEKDIDDVLYLLRSLLDDL